MAPSPTPKAIDMKRMARAIWPGRESRRRIQPITHGSTKKAPKPMQLPMAKPQKEASESLQGSARMRVPQSGHVIADKGQIAQRRRG